MKKIKKMIIFLAVILCILIGIILIINFINRDLNYIYNENVEGDIEVTPLNVSYFFSQYKGDVEQRTLYKALDLYINEKIEKYYNEIDKINQSGIENYYNKNSKNIFKELGIEDFTQFTSFIDEIKKLKGSSFELDKYTFYPEGIKKHNEYTEGIILVEYKGNEKIAFHIRVLNSNNQKRTPITLIGGVEQDYYEYEYEKPKDSGIKIDSPGKV